jgi:hypothetical protein
MMKSRRMRWAGHIRFCGKARRKESTRKKKRRWMEKFEMDLRQIAVQIMNAMLCGFLDFVIN